MTSHGTILLFVYFPENVIVRDLLQFYLTRIKNGNRVNNTIKHAKEYFYGNLEYHIHDTNNNHQ